MSYIPHDDVTRREMLAAIGVKDVGELFVPIPAELRDARIDMAPPLAEPALAAHVAALAAANRTDLVSFAGAGVYDHFIPAALKHVVGQSQFYTAYTPYQPEVSQGTLTVIFEFQTYVAALTGMEVANASMYDGATAAAEAALMCLRLRKGRNRVVLAPNLHPEYAAVVRTYISNLPGAEVAEAPCCAPYEPGGTLDVTRVRAAVDGAACFVMQYPNFFGLVETELAQVAAAVHDAGALLVVAANPMALAVLTPPGALGADVVVGEGQPFGLAPNFGGPGVGFFASRLEFVRQLPGRIVGRTTDRDGRVAYVLTLQTREQHIRREKATSNICSNHALGAATFTAYLSLVGATGLRDIARQNVANAAYAQFACSSVPGYKMAFEGPVFNEFVLHCPKDAGAVRQACRARGVDAGVPLGRFHPSWKEYLLVAVTEKRNRTDIDRLCAALAEAAA
jgi:glycine dehydrogenase subunit 1